MISSLYIHYWTAAHGVAVEMPEPKRRFPRFAALLDMLFESYIDPILNVPFPVLEILDTTRAKRDEAMREWCEARVLYSAVYQCLVDLTGPLDPLAGFLLDLASPSFPAFAKNEVDALIRKARYRAEEKYSKSLEAVVLGVLDGCPRAIWEEYQRLVQDVPSSLNRDQMLLATEFRDIKDWGQLPWKVQMSREAIVEDTKRICEIVDRLSESKRSISSVLERRGREEGSISQYLEQESLVLATNAMQLKTE
jgi:hypothetical protein